MIDFKTVAVVTGIAAVTASGASAAVVEYFDRTTFEAALLASSPGQTLVNEDFAGNVYGPEVSFIFGSNAVVANERLEDQANDGYQITSTTIFLDGVYNGFGGDWDLGNPGGAGTGLYLSFTGAGSTVSSTIANTYTGFYGVISGAGFTTVQIAEDNQANGVETYTLDNIVMGVVPLPAPAFLLLGALGGLGLLRRKAA